VTADEVAGFVALGGGALVLSTQRAFSPAVPAIAAPIAVAWPHGAPALGAGVVLGALLLGSPKRLPGPAFLLAVAFAVTIAVAGDGGLVRGGAAALAIAVSIPAYVRTVEEIAFAAVAFGLASAGVALGAAVAGVGGVRGELIAVGAAAGLAAAAGTGARAVAACDLAGVLALPSRAGVVAAAAALLGLLLLRRLAVVDAMLAGGAIAIAAIAGAPFTHAPWRTLDAFSDTYDRVGATGVTLFVLLLLATAWGLPRPFAPGDRPHRRRDERLAGRAPPARPRRGAAAGGTGCAPRRTARAEAAAQGARRAGDGARAAGAGPRRRPAGPAARGAARGAAPAGVPALEPPSPPLARRGARR
jgi:hypothetical protein